MTPGLLGSDLTFDTAQFFFLKPQTWNKHTLLHWWNFGGTTKDKNQTINAITLGGLFNLSGYRPDEIDGRYGGIGRLVYHYRLGNTNLSAFDTPVYIGASLEHHRMDA